MHPTLIIVPTYNERDNLPPLAARLLGLPVKVDLLVVDDNSPDGTGQLADQLSAADPRVQVLHRAGKQGLGTATLAGFCYAIDNGFEFVVNLDADFSHNPKYIPELIARGLEAHLIDGFDRRRLIDALEPPLKLADRKTGHRREILDAQGLVELPAHVRHHARHPHQRRELPLLVTAVEPGEMRRQQQELAPDDGSPTLRTTVELRFHRGDQRAHRLHFHRREMQAFLEGILIGANLTDLQLKYADVEPVQTVIDWLEAH